MVAMLSNGFLTTWTNFTLAPAVFSRMWTASTEFFLFIAIAEYAPDLSPITYRQNWYQEPWSKRYGTVMKVKRENVLRWSWINLDPPLKKGYVVLVNIYFVPPPSSNVESIENELNARHHWHNFFGLLPIRPKCSGQGCISPTISQTVTKNNHNITVNRRKG